MDNNVIVEVSGIRLEEDNFSHQSADFDRPHHAALIGSSALIGFGCFCLLILKWVNAAKPDTEITMPSEPTSVKGI